MVPIIAAFTNRHDLGDTPMVVAADARTLDEANVARAQSLVGLKGYVTNIGIDVMPAAEVIAKYHDRRVERSFSDVQDRPTSPAHVPPHPRRHRSPPDHRVFTALAVAHGIQERTGMAIAKVIKQLRPLRSATIDINGATQTFPPEVPASQREILDHLGIKMAY